MDYQKCKECKRKSKCPIACTDDSLYCEVLDPINSVKKGRIYNNKYRFQMNPAKKWDNKKFGKHDWSMPRSRSSYEAIIKNAKKSLDV